MHFQNSGWKTSYSFAQGSNIGNLTVVGFELATLVDLGGSSSRFTLMFFCRYSINP